MSRALFLFFAGVLCLACASAASEEPGLLFHLSGDRGFTADYSAGGTPEPNFLRNVKVIRDGARGPGFQCEGTQLMSYWAPGNIYAERGTLAFYWRSREPVGPTPFPIFRVGYADHSSWDMLWLRIDYNGRGFDAFVTDASLARVRVSHAMPRFPKPDEWVHLAFSWDETRGIRLYVNGKLAEKKDTTAVLGAGLDQFGPHSRIISPAQVQSAYNFIRGGDIDEIRIYDRMLSDDNIAALARGAGGAVGAAPAGGGDLARGAGPARGVALSESAVPARGAELAQSAPPGEIPPLTRDLSNPQWRDEWWWRYGWNRPGDAPPYLADRETSVRKVEIHDVYDLKRWWWKATDGIRETTWPGVFNRSRLTGRNDYFQLPDWDCYSLSGKAVTFTMPDEPWNQVEISGAAWGRMVREGAGETALFDRPKGQERTFHRLNSSRGGWIRFENAEQETPIGELSAYQVEAGRAPKGTARLVYTLTGAAPDYTTLKPLVEYIHGRYTTDERATVVGLPAALPRPPRRTAAVNSLPLVHVLIPGDFRSDFDLVYGWENMHDGLDGIILALPALKVRPTHGEYFPLNLSVQDPVWPLRRMLDFSFSVKPGEARTLWLDTRDRMLPNGKALYLTLAGAGADFSAASLEGAQVTLVFKARAEAVKEHVTDRFTQARDSFAHLIEEHTNTRRLNLYTRFETDLADLLRVDTDHFLGRAYWYEYNKEQPKPPLAQPSPPAGVPLWAFRQVEYLGYVKRFVLWYIDRRQLANGEFGGGLSDDGDMTNMWPPAAFMGCEPEKIRESLLRETDAFYAQGMFTNGLSTIQADELHSYEEGIQAVSQSMLLDYGSPKQLERAMETARSLIQVTGVNAAGHRHIRSSYFSGSVVAEEEPWGWSKASSYLILHPALLLVEYNGSPALRKVLLELADGLLAHRRRNESGQYLTHTSIQFQTDRDEWAAAPVRAYPVLWAAWRWTGDEKYLAPYRDEGLRMLETATANALDWLNLRRGWGDRIAAAASPDSARPTLRHQAWQVTGDKRYLESLYADQIEAAALREYINTEGSLWIDRVTVADGDLQRARLGGVALMRNYTYPGHAVSWRFAAPASDSSAAILIPQSTPQALKIIAYNLEQQAVRATMTGWEIDPGQWEVVEGVDTNGDDAPDGETRTRTLDLERSRDVEFTLPPRAAGIFTLKLVSRGTPYWERPDLGIGQEDVKVDGSVVVVKVHSLGAADSPATTLALTDSSGKRVATAPVPALKAPADLLPKTVEVRIAIPAGARIEGGAVTVDPDGKLREITRRNNRAAL